MIEEFLMVKIAKYYDLVLFPNSIIGSSVMSHIIDTFI